jgi:hypothetical protein
LGGSERHYRLEGGVTETKFGSLEGSQAVPASPSRKGCVQFFMREREKKVGCSKRHYRLKGGVTETKFGSLEGSQAVPASPYGKGCVQF